MKRAFGFAHGILCYVFLLGVFLRATWFVWIMDSLAPQSPVSHALLIDASLLGFFAVQHSGMARQGFKRTWTKLVPPLLERSTYVLVASLLLLAVVQVWQPLPGVVWTVRNPVAVMLLQLLF